MQQTIAILGRQPAIGLAELESLFGSEKITPLGKLAALIDLPPDEISYSRLGGSVKLAKLLTILDFTDWRRVSDYLIEHVPRHTCCLGPGKVIFGISTYGVKTNEKLIQRTGLEVKKAVRKAEDRPIRMVPTKGLELNSAQVLHNKMTQVPFGMELILAQAGNKIYLAQTTAVQDIDAYAARDQARPKRDARVGMLPPKLAQTIVNLARPTKSVLDPFCGTGVVLQEALLMGLTAYGSDLEPRMVEYSIENVDQWLRSQHQDINMTVAIEPGDAANHQWNALEFDAIAGETYLGRPFSHEPKPETLQEVMSDVATIHKKFLQNVATQTEAGFRLCLAVPAWNITGGFKHLSTLDHLEGLGYTRVSFKYASDKDLIYHREGQIVGRELVALIRK